MNDSRCDIGRYLVGCLLFIVASVAISTGCASTSSSGDDNDVDISERIAELTNRIDTDENDAQSPELMHQLADLHRERAQQLADRPLFIERSDERCFIPLEARWDESVFGDSDTPQDISKASNSSHDPGAHPAPQPVRWRGAGISPLSFDSPFTSQMYSGHCAAAQMQIADDLPADVLEDLEKSRVLYESISQQSSDYGQMDEVVFELGQIEMLVGSPAAAVQYLGSLVDTFPESEYVADARLIVADYFFIEQLFPTARDSYRQVLESQDPVLSTYAQFMIGWIDVHLSSSAEGQNPFEALLNRDLPPELNEDAVHQGAAAGLAYLFAITNRRDENMSPEDAVRFIESVTDRRSDVYEFFRILGSFCRTSTTTLFNCPEGAASVEFQRAVLKADDGDMMEARQLATELCDDGHSPSCDLLRSIEESNEY